MKLAVLFIVTTILIFRTDGFDLSLLGMGIDYIFDALKKVPEQLVNRPSNNANSIQYLLYTPNNTKESCLLEPSAERFEACSFNADYETKFLIHGFVEFLTPENLLHDLRDAILEHDKYNVIVVNWTLYNVLPFRLAYKNAETVGEQLAEMMNFMQTYAKVSLSSLHCIGHSLGCNVCGVAGRIVKTLGRITGLDPGGLSKFKNLKHNTRLYYTDADFVDAMHTSDVFSLRGLGNPEPAGHMDFYPNGGVDQPHCVIGNTYKLFKGKSTTVQTTLDKVLCNHMVTIEYFAHSLDDGCKFVATACDSYSDFEKGQCSSNTTVEMGFYAKKLDGIPPKTKLYLQTLENPPYCKGIE